VKFLVDGNILSEVTKSEPKDIVIEWLLAHRDEIAIDPVILGEIRFGILRLTHGKKRQHLESWFANGISSLSCLPWTAATGHRWAQLLDDLRKAGKAMPIKDSMIAATALRHDLIMVTRDVRDFEPAGLHLLNPFSD
jgi:predicted nucleic acid-binding protein